MTLPQKARDLVFVHIPKTGGTSVRRALAVSKRWDEVLLDYGATSSETSEAVRATAYGQTPLPLRTKFEPGANVLVSGHYVAQKYLGEFPDAMFVTFLRYPVSQVLSHFRHHVARHGYSAGLAEFCRTPRYQNLQSKYLAGVPLARFAFVGILEWLQFDLLTLSHLVGARLSLLHLNKLDVLPSIPVTHKQIAMVEAYNAEDMALYAEAVTLRSRPATGS